MLIDMDVDDEGFFEALRAREFGRLDDAGQAYLDFAGSGIYSASQVEAYADILKNGLFGNPHSAHRPSQDSSRIMETARDELLQFIGLDAATHTVCFTANTSAAVKLVAEAYPFSDTRGLVLTADNHNSINGIREFARARDARIDTIPIDVDLRLDAPTDRLASLMGSGGLFAFPAQSNFSGVRHPLDLAETAKSLGYDVLIDAAGLPPSALPALGSSSADFITLSFYKLFGLPTGVGALIVRNDALGKLKRPWFAGGTVDFVSVELDRHQLVSGAEGFEDGTPNFLGIAALPAGFALLRSIDSDRANRRLAYLSHRLLDALTSLRHTSGEPLVRLYGPQDWSSRGATISFNVIDPLGRALPYSSVERKAYDAGVAIRGGCFCNPGAAEAAFGFTGTNVGRCFNSLGSDFTISRFAECLGSDTPVGALRISLGSPTVARDLERTVGLIGTMAT